MTDHTDSESATASTEIERTFVRGNLPSREASSSKRFDRRTFTLTCGLSCSVAPDFFTAEIVALENKKSSRVSTAGFGSQSLVTSAATSRDLLPRLWQRARARINRVLAQQLFDAQELIVFRQPIGAAQRAGLDLAAVRRHSDVGDGCVRGCPGFGDQADKLADG